MVMKKIRKNQRKAIEQWKAGIKLDPWTKKRKSLVLGHSGHLRRFLFLITLTNPVSVICNFCNIYVFVFNLKNVFNIKSLVTSVSHSRPWIALYLTASSGFRVKWSSDSPWQPTHGGEGMQKILVRFLVIMVGERLLQWAKSRDAMHKTVLHNK